MSELEVPVLTMSHYQGKSVDDMTNEELRVALNAVWNSYMAVNRRTMGGDLQPVPPGDQERLERTLAEWFYGPQP